MQLFPNLLQATPIIGAREKDGSGKRDQDAERGEGPPKARSGRVERRGEAGVEYREGGPTRQLNAEAKAGRVGVRNNRGEGQGAGEETGGRGSELGAEERGVSTELMRNEPGSGGEETGSRPSIRGGGEVVEVENALDAQH